MQKVEQSTFQTWFAQRFEEWLVRDGGDKRGASHRFALAVGLKPSTIGQWRRGAAQPDEYSCILLSKVLAVPLEEVRRAAGRTMAVAEEQAPYGSAPNDEVLTEFRYALGEDYETLASLDAEDRRRLILAWAGIIHHHLELHRRIRELQDHGTA